MNAVLQRILTTETVTDGTAILPLRHPDFPSLPVAMDAAEGAYVAKIIEQVDPVISLEIGMAYGISTLYICEALAALGHPVRHIVMDPFQSTQWKGIGLRNIQQAGYEAMVEFHEARSEFLLPSLVDRGTMVEFALIDGWHTFDQVMVEFYFINRMLCPGGVVVFDDADRRSVNRAIRYVVNYPGYEVYSPSSGAPGRVSLFGRVRRALGRAPGVDKIVRRDLLHRDWDLGVLGSCVALRKTSDDHRSSGWYRDF
jgi:predicted O-methyltransferase YrrM